MLSSNDRRVPALLCRTEFDLNAEDSGIGSLARLFSFCASVARGPA
jgi:hypothetical protein